MFVRVLASTDGKLPQPMRAGVGLLANVAPKIFTTESDANLSMSDIGGGLIHQGTTLTSDVNYTLPTAASIAASFLTMDVGDAYSFMVNNSQLGAFDVVIVVNTGITKVGTNNTLSVPPQSTRIFTLIKTAAATYDLL